MRASRLTHRDNSGGSGTFITADRRGNWWGRSGFWAARLSAQEVEEQQGDKRSDKHGEERQPINDIIAVPELREKSDAYSNPQQRPEERPK
jgi:hypothetical protein